MTVRTPVRFKCVILRLASFTSISPCPRHGRFTPETGKLIEAGSTAEKRQIRKLSHLSATLAKCVRDAAHVEFDLLALNALVLGGIRSLRETDMRKSRYTEEQMIGALKDHAAGCPIYINSSRRLRLLAGKFIVAFTARWRSDHATVLNDLIALV